MSDESALDEGEALDAQMRSDAVSYVVEPGSRDFDEARETTRRAHKVVVDKIAELVRARAAVNDEIKVLRSEEDRLGRMLRIADAPSKAGADE